jgi:transketolase
MRLLHLTGYDLPIDEFKRFRQLGSARPRATPKYGYAPGIDTTTGPLGQGIANAVGFALAEQMLATRVQPPRA